MQLKQSLETYLFLSQVRSSPHIMEPKGSPPCSQQPSLVPILSQINPVHATLCISLISTLILSSHKRCVNNAVRHL